MQLIGCVGRFHSYKPEKLQNLFHLFYYFFTDIFGFIPGIYVERVYNCLVLFRNSELY